MKVPDVLDRLNAAAAAIESLNALVTADKSLDYVLHGVATYAEKALAGRRRRVDHRD